MKCHDAAALFRMSTACAHRDLRAKARLGRSKEGDVHLLAPQWPTTGRQGRVLCPAALLQLRGPLEHEDAGQQNEHGEPNEPREAFLGQQRPVDVGEEHRREWEDGLQSHEGGQGAGVLHRQQDAHVPRDSRPSSFNKMLKNLLKPVDPPTRTFARGHNVGFWRLLC